MNASGIRRYTAHPPATETELAIDAAIREYASHNGVETSVSYGIWKPEPDEDVGCVCGDDVPFHLGEMVGRRAIITVRTTPDQTVVWKPGTMPGGGCETPVRDRGDPIEDCREAVATALHARVAWLRRAKAIGAAGSDPRGDPPIWAMSVHPFVRAVLPDLAARLGVDPLAVRATAHPAGGYVRPMVPETDSFRIDGSRIVMGMFRIGDGVWMEQDSTGLRVHLADRLPLTLLSGLTGRGIGDVIDVALPDDVATSPILAAIHHAGGTSLRIAPAWTPAAGHPDGDDAWRLDPSAPPAWGAATNRSAGAANG